MANDFGAGAPTPQKIHSSPTLSDFPRRLWHPETGEDKVFKQREDVPPGWLDYHPKDEAKAKAAAAVKPAPEPVVEEVLPMTREEIVAALDDAGIEYKPKASDKKLYATLLFNARKFLSEHDIDFPEDADAKTLLGLIPKPE